MCVSLFSVCVVFSHFLSSSIHPFFFSHFYLRIIDFGVYSCFYVTNSIELFSFSITCVDPGMYRFVSENVNEHLALICC